MELRGPPAYLIVAVHRGLDLGIVTDCRLGVAFAEAPQCQQRSPLGLTRPPGGPTDDYATAL
jgi:hypothetical protein